MWEPRAKGSYESILICKVPGQLEKEDSGECMGRTLLQAHPWPLLANDWKLLLLVSLELCEYSRSALDPGRPSACSPTAEIGRAHV